MRGTHTIGGQAMFLALTWDMHYRKSGGRWLISGQRLDWQYLTPYELRLGQDADGDVNDASQPGRAAQSGNSLPGQAPDTGRGS